MSASSLRPRAGDALVMAVAHRLTQRDRSILTMLSRHRVFTTDQLAEMYFDNTNTAQHRLTTLYKLRLVDRFQPLDHRYASLPYHYVLDQLGAMVVAAERGEDPDTSRWRADKALAIGKSQRLGHLVGVNGFFSDLQAESRRREDCDLSLWWSERHCTSQFDRIAQPDGLGVWEEGGNRVVFCLEYDRSTEALERLEKKLKSYEDLQVASGLAYWIVFCFGHPRREAGARRVLAQATVPVATAALGPTQRPHEAIWAPIGDESVRLRLAELAAVPMLCPSPRTGSQRLRRTGGERPSSGGGRSERRPPHHPRRWELGTTKACETWALMPRRVAGTVVPRQCGGPAARESGALGTPSPRAPSAARRRPPRVPTRARHHGAGHRGEERARCSGARPRPIGTPRHAPRWLVSFASISIRDPRLDLRELQRCSSPIGRR